MLKAIRQLFKKNKADILPEYQKWRDVIFSAIGEQVDVSSSQPDQVYGVVKDVGLAEEDGTPVDTNHVIIVTAFASGASF